MTGCWTARHGAGEKVASTFSRRASRIGGGVHSDSDAMRLSRPETPSFDATSKELSLCAPHLRSPDRLSSSLRHRRRRTLPRRATNDPRRRPRGLVGRRRDHLRGSSARQGRPGRCHRRRQSHGQGAGPERLAARSWVPSSTGSRRATVGGTRAQLQHRRQLPRARRDGWARPRDDGRAVDRSRCGAVHG